MKTKLKMCRDYVTGLVLKMQCHGNEYTILLRINILRGIGPVLLGCGDYF
jgi:hypothetical protein